MQIATLGQTNRPLVFGNALFGGWIESGTLKLNLFSVYPFHNFFSVNIVAVVTLCTRKDICSAQSERMTGL